MITIGAFTISCGDLISRRVFTIFFRFGFFITTEGAIGDGGSTFDSSNALAASCFVSFASLLNRSSDCFNSALVVGVPDGTGDGDGDCAAITVVIATTIHMLDNLISGIRMSLIDGSRLDEGYSFLEKQPRP